MIDEDTIDRLVAAAKTAADFAYVPYSNYPIGAAVLTASGLLFAGANIENMSFGATVCAERVAVYKAVSEGNTDIIALAVYHNGKDLPYPCGMCRQVLAEFSRHCRVFIANDEHIEEHSMRELLPLMFETDELG